MGVVLRAVAALIFIGALPAKACPNLNLEVQTRYAAPWVSHPTLAMLNARYGNVGESTWLGSTASRLQTDVSFRSSGYASASACTPATIRVDLSFAEHEVNVASEVVGLPCLKKVVLHHEMQHVNLNRKMLEQMRPIVSQYVASRVPAILRRVPPVSQGAAVTIFVEGELKTLIDGAWAALGAQQAALDTKSEYAKLAAACPVEMAMLARGVEQRPMR